MKFVDLTHSLLHGQSGFPGDPQLCITPHGTIAAQKCNVTQISLGSHQGTHLDAMAHFDPSGRTVDQMPLDWFFGPVHVLRIPKLAGEELTVEDFSPYERHLVPGARIIYETGWHRRFGKTEFYSEFPSLTQAAARYLVSRRIRLLGMDTPTPSRDWYEVHHILLDRPAETVIVESLAHLDQVPDNFIFAGFPLLIAGCDGSPIRAVALIDQASETRPTVG